MISMNVRSQGSVPTVDVKTCLELTAVCVTKVSSRLRTAKHAVILTSVKMFVYVHMGVASTQRALSTASATQDTSALRKAATVKISMSVRGHPTAKGDSASTVWDPTIVNAPKDTLWWEAGDAKT